MKINKFRIPLQSAGREKIISDIAAHGMLARVDIANNKFQRIFHSIGFSKV